MKRTKKLLSLLLALALILTAIPFSGISVSAYDEPTFNDEGYYEISTASHLYWFAEQVNSGNNAINGVLLNDIAVNEEDDNPDDNEEIAWISWTPIGNANYEYQGIFDGAGYTITNMVCASDTYGGIFYVGMFGSNAGTIKNLIIDKSTFEGKSACVGAICGTNKGTIQNCHNLCAVTGTGGFYSDVGGVAGRSTGEIKNCSNSGEITNASNKTGGICGSAIGKIEKSFNTGSVAGVNYVGGICGYSESESLDELTGDISYCYNTGKVSGEASVGGICGVLSKSGINSCYNVGEVSGTDRYIGAILGEFSGFGVNDVCYLTGCATDGSGKVQNALGSSTLGYAAEDDDIHQKQYGKTTEDFASGEVAYLLNAGVTDGTQVWYQNIDKIETVNAMNKDVAVALRAFYQSVTDEGFDALPQFDGATVYENEICTSDGIINAYSNTFTPIEHTFVNCICTVCGTSLPAELVTEENYEDLGLTEEYIGYYAVANANDLYWFAEQVNSGNNSINGVLMNDIVVNEGDLSGYDGASENNWKEWTPIGNEEYFYLGTFDGAGYSVSGLYFNDEQAYVAGLFGVVSGTVKNVNLKNSYFSATVSAGICGLAFGGSILNCSNEGTIKGLVYTGGVCANNWGIIQNCYNIGNVIGEEGAGGICGINNIGVIQNCYNIGRVISEVSAGSVSGINNAFIQNCYYLEGCTIDGSGTVQNGAGSYTEGSTTEDVDGVTNVKSAEQFASGEVAYLLNEGVTDGSQVWYQNIDNGELIDETPKFIGGTVYQYYNTCEDDIAKYSNTDKGSVTEHKFNNGVCYGCGASFINPWKSQIRFDKNEDGTFAGTFDYRVLATITSDDLLSTFGTENIAIQSMVEAGFVMAKSDDVSGFDYEIAKNVVKGTSDAYTKAPVEWISTALDPDASTSGAGDYVISCIVEDIPEADKNLCLATMAYIVYNDADGNLCYMFYPAINTVCFEGLYEQYYSLAFPS